MKSSITIEETITSLKFFYCYIEIQGPEGCTHEFYQTLKKR